MLNITEEQYLEMEAARNDFADEYFKARPQIDCTDGRIVFDAGFDRGWKAALQAKNNTCQQRNSERRIK